MKNAISWLEISTTQLGQALPPGMGFFAHNTDLDGNRVGLHALV